MGYFVEGLKPNIRSRIRNFKPQTHYQALQLAWDIEVEFETWFQKEEGGLNWDKSGMWGTSRVVKNGLSVGRTAGNKGVIGPSQSQATEVGFSFGSGERSHWSGGQSSTSTQGSTTRCPTTATKHHEVDQRGSFERNKGIRYLSYGELMDSKTKGLCLRCGDKFHPLHCCTD